MNIKEIKSLLSECEALFKSETKLIEPKSARVIFAGDTHGDIDATKKIIQRYLKEDATIIFLGDYVDRGPDSAQNLHTLLKLKLKHPSKIFLLMGNHEGVKANRVHPADFWESLTVQIRHEYTETLSHLPFAAATINGIIALHGALPDTQTLQDINRIKFGSQQWRQITWGDWQETGPGDLGEQTHTARPWFDRLFFDEVMERFGKNVLIRSHQPNIDPVIFNRRCLTLFTSRAYNLAKAQRNVAIASMDKDIKTVDDLQIESI